MKKVGYLFLLVSAVVSCQNTNPRFDEALTNNSCEIALEQIPEKQFGLKFASKTQKVMGTVFSYTATAAGYTAQVFVDTSKSAGYILGCTIISVPFGVIFGNSVSQACVDSSFKNYKTKTYGQDAYSKTAPFRCSNLNGLSDSMLKVSKCYENQKTLKSQVRALNYLKAIRSSNDFYNCLPDEKKDLILEKILLLEQQIVLN